MCVIPVVIHLYNNDTACPIGQNNRQHFLLTWKRQLSPGSVEKVFKYFMVKQRQKTNMLLNVIFFFSKGKFKVELYGQIFSHFNRKGIHIILLAQHQDR